MQNNDNNIASKGAFIPPNSPGSDSTPHNTELTTTVIIATHEEQPDLNQQQQHHHEQDPQQPERAKAKCNRYYPIQSFAILAAAVVTGFGWIEALGLLGYVTAGPYPSLLGYGLIYHFFSIIFQIIYWCSARLRAVKWHLFLSVYHGVFFIIFTIINITGILSIRGKVGDGRRTDTVLIVAGVVNGLLAVVVVCQLLFTIRLNRLREAFPESTSGQQNDDNINNHHE